MEALGHVCGEGANLGEIYNGHFAFGTGRDGQPYIAFCFDAWNDVTVRMLFPPGMGKYVPPTKGD